MMRITVITVTYQAATVLQRTLNSVGDQRYPEVEHLIIDGGSTDGTVAMAEAYASYWNDRGKGHRVVVRSERDKGLYDAMNKGLRMATGTYVVFLNAGDRLHAADTLQKIAAAAEEHDSMPCVVYGLTDVVDEQGVFLRHRRLAPPQKLSWRSVRQGMLVCHQAFYARTDVAKAHPYDLHYRLSADVDWCIRVMKAGEQEHAPLVFVREVVVDYLDGGMSVKNHRASLWERFAIMRHHYGLLTTLVMHAWFVLRGIGQRLR